MSIYIMFCSHVNNKCYSSQQFCDQISRMERKYKIITWFVVFIKSTNTNDLRFYVILKTCPLKPHLCGNLWILFPAPRQKYF